MFILLHCPYNPDTYTGHRIEQLKATDWAAAKLEADAILKARWNRIQWEYRLIEVGEDSGYRLHDTEAPSWLVGGKY